MQKTIYHDSKPEARKAAGKEGSKKVRTIIVSKATRVTAQALYNHRGRKC